jgi:hypothetical protein
METIAHVKSIKLSARIIRADGSVEELGVIAQSDPLATQAELVVESITEGAEHGDRSN